MTIAIITVSTTRTLEDDESGHWIRRRAQEEGHCIVAHRVVSDDASAVVKTVQTMMQNESPQVILLTGGTGISPDDLTIEALKPMFSKELAAFGPLFAQLSYEQIGSPALLSRAIAGVINNTVVFCMPGSLKACRLACQSLIFPELGHVVHHAQADHFMKK